MSLFPLLQATLPVLFCSVFPSKDYFSLWNFNIFYMREKNNEYLSPVLETDTALSSVRLPLDKRKDQ